MFVELKAEVHVKPRPADFNSNLGAQDPRRGRYAKVFYKKLKIIDNILSKKQKIDNETKKDI